MKVFYLNDRKVSAWVSINGLYSPVELKPAEGRVFEVPAPEGALPFIKVWENNQVMLSYIESDCLPGRVS